VREQSQKSHGRHIERWHNLLTSYSIRLFASTRPHKLLTSRFPRFIGGGSAVQLEELLEFTVE